MAHHAPVPTQSASRHERAQRSPFMADVQAEIDAEEDKLTKLVERSLLVALAIVFVCLFALLVAAIERLNT